MRRRLLVAMVAVAAAATVLLGIPLGTLGQRDVRAAATGRLERDADGLAASLRADLAAGRRVDRARIAALLADEQRAEVVVPDGRRFAVGPAPGHEPVRATAGAGGQLTVRLSAPEGSLDRQVGGVWLAVLLLALPAIALAMLAAVVLSRRLARPLEVLAERAVDPGAAGPATRSGIAEIDALASALDAGRADLKHLLARERAFSSDVAHQVRGPLTALRMRLEELESLAASPEARSEAEAALRLADRAEQVLGELEHYAREGTAGPAALIDVGAVVREAAAAWRGELARTRRAIEVDASGEVRARAGEGAVRQALDVLIDNARRHGRGTVTLTVRAVDGGVVVAVGDEGPGIAPEAAGRIFDRRVSLGGGSGLGLSVARALLRADGADLRLAGARGATFEVVLPPAGAPR